MLCCLLLAYISYRESLKRSVTDTVGRCMRQVKHVFLPFFASVLCVCVYVCVNRQTKEDTAWDVVRGVQ